MKGKAPPENIRTTHKKNKLFFIKNIYYVQLSFPLHRVISKHLVFPVCSRRVSAVRFENDVDTWWMMILVRWYVDGPRVCRCCQWSTLTEETRALWERCIDTRRMPTTGSLPEKNSFEESLAGLNVNVPENRQLTDDRELRVSLAYSPVIISMNSEKGMSMSDLCFTFMYVLAALPDFCYESSITISSFRSTRSWRLYDTNLWSHDDGISTPKMGVPLYQLGTAYCGYCCYFATGETTP